MTSYVFTSESVSEGHPDKICDYISDSIVDAFLARDKDARTAIEAMATTNRVCLAGETRGGDGLDASDMIGIVRNAVKEIGYEQKGFHWKTLDIDCWVHEQSEDIAQGVDESEAKPLGAGDQGIMFGYACTETESLMPAAIHYSHAILRALAKTWRSEPSLGLGPDAKAQVSLVYENGQPRRAESVVVSIQHRDDMPQSRVEEIVREHVRRVLPKTWLDDKTVFHINPTGRFVVGGPDGDAGLTGRKIIVDTYGGAAPHGGGAFSGKDPSKVDRSAAYAARYLAKNIVAAGLSRTCLIQLSYAIGVSQPLSVYVSTNGTGAVADIRITEAVKQIMDLSPQGIRAHLKLQRPIYKPTAAYGHFGRTPLESGEFSWEKTDLVEQFKEFCL